MQAVRAASKCDFAVASMWPRLRDDMPTFYFHVRDGQYFPDESGTEFPGLREAQLAAIKLAADLLEDESLFWQGEEWSLQVTDETGGTLFTLSFTASDRAALGRIKN